MEAASRADRRRRRPSVAMRQITAPIIAITLVLLSVFVPVAFIPGISGELFRQFAVTVAVSMFLSAINALTLSPALCALLLRPHHGPRRGTDRRGDARHRLGARRLWRGRRAAGAHLDHRPGAWWPSRWSASWAWARSRPTGFLPEEDQGAFFVVVQLPDGASIGRTTEVVRQVEDILKQEHAIADYSSTIGLNFIDNYSQPNAAFLIVSLKPFEERADAAQSAPALIARLGAEVPRRCAAARAVPLAPPPIIGLGTGGGFSYVLQDYRAAATRRRWRRCCAACSWRPTRIPKLSRVFSTFSADNAVDLPRYRPRQGAGARRSISAAIFQALQASLGGYYVNDMNLFGRTWQVQVQAEAEDRASIDDIYRINVRSADGKMIPLRSLVEVRVVIGPQALIRYNNRLAVTVQGSPAPGVSSGQALAAMEQVAREDAADGLSRRRGPTSRSRRSAPKARPRSSSASRCCSPTCSWSACTRAGPFRCRCCCRSRSAWSAPSSASCCRSDARSLRADRHGGADRPRGEERHPDRGVRQGAARARACRCSRRRPRARGCASAR